MNQSLSSLLGIEHPIIMAPMFLVSDQKMMEAAMDNGIAGCIPSLNFRKEEELDGALNALKKYKSIGQTGTYGVNLIAQKSNPKFTKHLEICLKNEVPFFITSLGNPKLVIEGARAYGGKVLCDVTNLVHAEKVAKQGCDGFIAVCSGAGGHAGPHPPHILIPSLRKNFPEIPVVAAGGIATGYAVNSMMELGAAGASIGTRFIASEEAPVNLEYKQAIVDSGMDEIMSTTRLSGTPCNVIATPYAKKLGSQQNWIERSLSNNPRTKKYFKMFIQLKGMKQLEKALKPGNYKTLWGAGQSVEYIDDILPTKTIVDRMVSEMKKTNQI